MRIYKVANLQKLDKYWIGILTGLVLPALFIAFYVHQFHLLPMLRAFDWHGEVLTQMCVLSVFPDAALLFVLYTLELWRTARGVMLGIFPYLIAAIAVAI